MKRHQQSLSTQSSLLLRPHPFKDEGPKGYLLRLAEANWMPPSELQGIGLIYELGTLKSEGLLPSEDVYPELHNRIGNYSNLLFNKKRVWNHQYPRFCPHCLSEDSYWRVEWELMFHDACASHGVWLIDKCSSCGDKISWNRQALIRCQCGADLRAEETSSCPAAVQTLSRILKFKINPSSNLNIGTVPFTNSDIDQTQRIIRYLGTYMSLAAGKNPLKIRQAGSMNNSWMVTTLAAEIVSNWPQSFYQSLDNIQRESTLHKPTLSSVFGYAYHYLYKGFKGAGFKELRDEFETWLSASWKGGLAKRNKRLASLILEKAQWIPSNLAAETLGVSHQRLSYLIREGALEGETYISEKGRKFIMVRRDSFDVVKGNLNAEIDMKTAGLLLGLCKKRMRQLMQLLFPEASKNGISNSSPWAVCRFEINKLLAVGDDLDRVSIVDEDCVSLKHILRYWAWDIKDIYMLIHSVRIADISPINILEGAVGISGWNFNEKFIRVWKLRDQQGLGKWLTITQAAKVLGIKEQVGYEMVRKGFLKAEVMPKQIKRGIRVKRSAIEQFADQYTFSTEIADKYGISSKKVIAILEQQQIFPISGPRVDGGRQVLYLRDAKIKHFLSEIKAEDKE